MRYGILYWRFMVFSLVYLLGQLFWKNRRDPFRDGCSPLKDNCECLFLGRFMSQTMLVVHLWFVFSYAINHDGCSHLVSVFPCRGLLRFFSIWFVPSHAMTPSTLLLGSPFELISGSALAYTGTVAPQAIS